MRRRSGACAKNWKHLKMSKKINKKNRKNNRPDPYGTDSPEYVIAKRRKRLRDKDEITTFIIRLIIMIAFVYILFGKIFGLALVDNDDMKPRLSGGDLMLYYRLQNKWYADDVVVFEKDGERYTGRIVATEGDKVDIPDEGGLHINGSTVLEADIFYPTKKYETGIEFPVTLGKNEFFILCDYREGEKDSRFFGPVKASELKGKVITVMRRTNL